MAEALSSLLDTTGSTSETTDVATGVQQKAKRPKPKWVMHREEVTGESWDFNEDSGKWERQTENVGSKNVEAFQFEKETNTGPFHKDEPQIASGKKQSFTSQDKSSADEVFDSGTTAGMTREQWHTEWAGMDEQTKKDWLDRVRSVGKKKKIADTSAGQ